LSSLTCLRIVECLADENDFRLSLNDDDDADDDLFGWLLSSIDGWTRPNEFNNCFSLPDDGIDEKSSELGLFGEGVEDFLVVDVEGDIDVVGLSRS